MPEYVYILTNEMMPDIVKIGYTNNLKKRMKELSKATGVPLPFECYYCCEVKKGKGKEIETSLIEGFGDDRVNPKREFFKKSPYRVKAILKPHSIKDVTPDEDVVDSQEESRALGKARKMRDRFTFPLVEISIGSTISFVKDESITAVVSGDREVEYEGEKMFLSVAAQKVFNDKFNKQYQALQGPAYWMFESETLLDRRLRMEDEKEENEAQQNLF